MQEDLVHSIAKGAVEAERKFICAALQCDLRDSISRDEGLRNEVACMFYGMAQNGSQEVFVSQNREGSIGGREEVHLNSFLK